MAYFSSTVAVVGGGASGTLVAAQLLRQTVHPLRVVLYEPAEAPGMGLAYGTAEFSHLLNVPAGRISALPDQPAHFLEWLNSPANCASLLHGRGFSAGEFVPRAFYARYLASVLEETVAAGRLVHARFEHRCEKVVDFVPGRDGGTIVSASADTEDVAHVVLALGNLPPRDPLSGFHPFFQSPRYVANVWQEHVLEEISLDDDVLVVGSGLTAFDVIVSLHRNGHRGKIHVTSRNGRFPQTHQAHPAYPDFLKDQRFPTSVRSWFRLLREEVNRAAEEGVDWRPVLDAVRPHTQAIWLSLDSAGRRQFLRHVRAIWESHRHRAPLATRKVVDALSHGGQLEFLPGRLKGFQENDGVQVTIQPKAADHPVTIKVARVLNCIGPESNFRQHLNDRLIINLMARGVLHPDPLFLGIDATEDGQVIGAGRSVFSQVSTLGPPLRGILWESTAIPEIRTQAERLASRILANIPFPGWQI